MSSITADPAMPVAVEAAPALGAFSADAGARAAARDAALLARLDELGRIRVEGADAASFLQSQLTNDVAHLGPEALQLNGYCTPKGRLIATFHQWREGDAIVLQLPREVLPGVLKRLAMFVLRAKARLTDASAAQAAWGLVGPRSVAALAARGVAVPSAPWTCTLHEGVRIARLPGAPQAADRFLLIADASHDVAGWLGLAASASGAWWWSQVAAAVPTVFAATQEKFVPQMINFEVLGGVDFKKGCYPGQEIVARSQYLGKLKRRMQPAHAGIEAPPAAGSDVLADGAPVGTVVMAAQAPGGGVDVLIELPLEQAAGPLTLADGTPLAARPLPYTLFDPTA
jgi:folate-binding protein YgfZ